MSPRIYTVKEANRALPVLRKVVGLIQDRMRWLTENPPEMEYLVQEHRIPMDSPVDPEYFVSLLRLRRALGKIEEMGCQLKDIQAGLVDFPARLFGKDVLLCWRVGEETVGYYHDLSAGYAGRQPIPPGEEEPEDPEQEGS